MITSLKIKTTPTTNQWLGVKWRNMYAVDWRVAVCHALVFLIFDAYNCISSIVREVEKSFHFKLMTPKHHYFQRMRWEHSHSLTRISLSFVACVNVSGCLFLLLFLFVFFLKFKFIVHPIEWVATRNIFDIHKWNNEVRRYRIKRSQLTRKRRSEKNNSTEMLNMNLFISCSEIWVSSN